MEDLTTSLRRWAAPRGAMAFARYAAHADAVAAAGRGDFEMAFVHASSISRAGELQPCVPHALWVVLDLVEAAVRTGRHADARAHVRAAQEAGIAAISSRMNLLVTAAEAVAGTGDPLTSFRAALTADDVGRLTPPASDCCTAKNCAGGAELRKREPNCSLPGKPSRTSTPHHGSPESAMSWVHRSACTRSSARHHRRPADPATSQDRQPRSTRAHEQGNRQIAPPLTADRVDTPVPGLSQAQRHDQGRPATRPVNTRPAPVEKAAL